jgi:N6-adenosine-specific RNA methylase IME4
VPGQGNWVRQQHELLLIGRKGKHPAPDTHDTPTSILTHRKGPHSAKPDPVYQILERMYPHASKVELFARGTPRAGWAAWGNQLTR